MSDLDNSDYYTSEISDTEVDQDFDSKNTSTNGSKKILSQEKKNISANNSNLINGYLIRFMYNFNHILYLNCLFLNLLKVFI